MRTVRRISTQIQAMTEQTSVAPGQERGFLTCALEGLCSGSSVVSASTWLMQVQKLSLGSIVQTSGWGLP